MSSRRAVLFDFDFTLADSSAGIIECVNHALGTMGLPGRPPQEIVNTIGLSLAETFHHLTGNPDSAVALEFSRCFTRRADQVMESLTHLYEPAPRLIRALRAASYSLAIVSTKYRYRLASILTTNGLLADFAAIVGAEDVAAHKPDPAGILAALRQLAVRADDAVYVGDHVVDAEAAQRAGVSFIAVLTGTFAREAFAPFPSRAIVSDLSNLADVLGLAAVTS